MTSSVHQIKFKLVMLVVFSDLPVHVAFCCQKGNFFYFLSLRMIKNIYDFTNNVLSRDIGCSLASCANSKKRVKDCTFNHFLTFMVPKV